MDSGIFREIILNTGFMNLTLGNIIMWAIALLFIFLAIRKNYEPLLLVPIGFGMFIVNLPLSGLMDEGGLLWVPYTYAIDRFDLIPPIIFMGIGAMTDFRPVLANPKTLLLGAAAQFGVYITFFGALMLGFSLPEAASIGIIGGADGPTTIFLTSKLAPHLLGATAVAAYSYMALVPIIQPPIMKLLTTRAERRIRMKSLRHVSKLEAIGFPLVATLIICLLIPAATPLVGMFMVGNLFKESGVVERLSSTAQNELINIVTIFLGLCIGATMPAAVFLRPESLFIFALGMVAFSFSTAAGIVMAKIMNLFLTNKLNPLIGAAGVSAVPMAARVAQIVARNEDKGNFILMQAMGPNVAGVIGTLAAAGLFLSMLG
ncbi:MAG: sodium ion-translocating decarboxylase subunit beta [Syntrophales bacterium]|jgi:oxaloacetate decarboxylase beta subunit|nr:sodium ion-translocating decarboxylase subunit beta [Syntrophales bacterium]MCK9528259.1 sodium ion-translocating decarboxylase subunit beta [Syntrophales bacterium]MDX9922391.1 sodium ion-translocating decarboxylase subunit beta [Syntrophales bacterium]